MKVSKKRREELEEIASRICEMDPESVHLVSANWLEEQGCRSMTECCIVRAEVYDRKGWIA